MFKRRLVSIFLLTLLLFINSFSAQGESIIHLETKILSAEEKKRLLDIVNQNETLRVLFNELQFGSYNRIDPIFEQNYLNEVTMQNLDRINNGSFGTDLIINLYGRWSFEIYGSELENSVTLKDDNGNDHVVDTYYEEENFNFIKKYNVSSIQNWEWIQLLGSENIHLTLNFSYFAESDFLHLMKKDALGNTFYDYFENRMDKVMIYGVGGRIPTDQLDGRETFFNFDLFIPSSLIKEEVRQSQRVLMLSAVGGRFPVFSYPDDYSRINVESLKYVDPNGNEQQFEHDQRFFSLSSQGIVLFENGKYLQYDPNYLEILPTDLTALAYYSKYNNLGKIIAYYTPEINEYGEKTGDFVLDQETEITVFNQRQAEQKAIVIDRDPLTLNDSLIALFENKVFNFGGPRNIISPLMYMIWQLHSDYEANWFFSTGGFNYSLHFKSNRIIVEYVDENGTPIKESKIMRGAPASTFNIDTPDIDGYTFKSTKDGAPLTGAFTKSTEQTITLIYAKNLYTVRFQANGGTFHGAGSTFVLETAGGQISPPAPPTRQNYTFDGWYKDASLKEEFDFDAVVNSDITLYAKWKRNAGNVVTPELNKDDHLAYIFGYPDNTVRPQGKISREEVAAILSRNLHPDYRDTITGPTTSFPDIRADRWSAGYIATLKNAGIINGYEDGTFRATNPITRAEVVKMFSAFSKLDSGVSSFSDIHNHWAKDEISLLAAEGWINGYENGTFHPDAHITRAEFVAITNRALNRGTTEEHMLEGHRKFPDLHKGAWYYDTMLESINGHHYVIEDEIEKWISFLSAPIRKM